MTVQDIAKIIKNIIGEQMNQCIETKIIRLCSTGKPMLISNKDAPCEVHLFIGDAKLHTVDTNGKLRAGSLKRNLYHKLKYSNDWIYSTFHDRIIISRSHI